MTQTKEDEIVEMLSEREPTIKDIIEWVKGLKEFTIKDKLPFNTCDYYYMDSVIKALSKSEERHKHLGIQYKGLDKKYKELKQLLTQKNKEIAVNRSEVYDEMNKTIKEKDKQIEEVFKEIENDKYDVLQIGLIKGDDIVIAKYDYDKIKQKHLSPKGDEKCECIDFSGAIKLDCSKCKGTGLKQSKNDIGGKE